MFVLRFSCLAKDRKTSCRQHCCYDKNTRVDTYFTSCVSRNTALSSCVYLGPLRCTMVWILAKRGSPKKTNKSSSSRKPKPSDKSNHSEQFVDSSKEQSPSIGSHRQGIGLNDIPVDLGEVVSDPLLEEEEEESETREFPADENSWKHAVEYALEEIHSQVKYSESQFSWMKPFTTSVSKNVLLCQRCDGTGMMTCEYCHGQGFVRFGPGNNFRIRYRHIEVVLPRRVWGDLYYCPVCGGLRRERCITCYGSGTLQTKSSNIPTEEERIESLRAQQTPKRGKHRIYFLRDINQQIEEKSTQLGGKQHQRKSSEEEEDIDFLE